MVWNHSFAGESRTRRSMRGDHCRTKKVPLLSLERLESRTMFTGNQAEAAELAVMPVLDVAAPVDDALLQIVTASQNRTASSGMNLLVADGSIAAEPSQQSMTVNQYVDWLAEQAANRWDHLFGQSVNRVRPYCPIYGNDLPFQGFVPGIDLIDRDVGVITLADSGIDGMPLGTVAMSTLAMRTAGSAVDAMAMTAVEFSSDTNVQVEGVDEADLVEVDGATLFTLSRRGRLAIVDASDPTHPQVLFQVQIGQQFGRSVGMYLHDDVLTILQKSHQKTTITVLDVADHENLSLVKQLQINSELVDTRMVDGQLRLVARNSLWGGRPQILGGDPLGTVIPGDIVLDQDFDRMVSQEIRQDVQVSMYESREAYIARFREIVLNALPQLHELGADGSIRSSYSFLDHSKIIVPEPGNGCGQLTTVLAIDVTGDPATSVSGFAFQTTGSVETFSSKDSLYIFDTSANETRIIKVSFDDSGCQTTVIPAAMGTVKGRFLNQFAASEHDGCLRLVVGDRSRGSSVIVLQQDGEQLAEIGRLDGLAPREDLYSVRFTDSRVYLVTFLRVDPLFVVDLSDHTSPTLLGELKVPGFSDHIEILDENHLLTIGCDASDTGGRGWTQFGGLQVSIFDVSDPTQPRLRHRYTFSGGRGTSTAVTGHQVTRGDGDHLALGFFPELGIMTMPTEQGAGWWNRSGGKQQLDVLAIGIETGISHRGVIDHETEVTRAVQICSHLVATSSTKVTTHSLSSPTDIVGAAQLHDVGILSAADLPIMKVGSLVTLSKESGRTPLEEPLFNLWTAEETQEIDGQQTLFAEHISGARHQIKISGQVSGNIWALFGFNDISNQDNRILESELRDIASKRQEESNTIERLVSAGLSESELTTSENDKNKQHRGVFFAADTAE